MSVWIHNNALETQNTEKTFNFGQNIKLSVHSYIFPLHTDVNTISNTVQYASVFITEFISMDQFNENRINLEFMFAYRNDRI